MTPAASRVVRLLVFLTLVGLGSTFYLTSSWRGPTTWILDNATKLGVLSIIGAVGIAYYHASVVRKFNLRSNLQTPFAALGPLVDPFFNGGTYGVLILSSLRSLNAIADHGAELALAVFDRVSLVVLLLAAMAWSIYRSAYMVMEAWTEGRNTPG